MTIWTERMNMPFEIKDCTLIARMGGVDSAINLRELRERTAVCPLECLFHHFCETLIRPTFDDPEFRNDFAVWSVRTLRDRVLAERLGIINPYSFENFEELREHILEIFDERLSEQMYTPSAPRGEDFRFMRAVTVVFDTELVLETPNDLIKQIQHFSYSSIYYHFIEARRRTPDRMDDFTEWLKGFGNGTEKFIETLGSIDFYYLTLPELKQALVQATKSIKTEVSNERQITGRI
jgi:hypothetical protein